MKSLPYVPPYHGDIHYENKNKRKPWKMYYVKTETIEML